MKYRLRRRAHGWAVQYYLPHWDNATQSYKDHWETVETYRWHWLAALRLLILRERARK